MKTTPDGWIERNDMVDEPGQPNPEDCCMVCGKLDCVCPPEEDLGAPIEHIEKMIEHGKKP